MEKLSNVVTRLQQKQSGSQQSLQTQNGTSLPVAQDLHGQAQMVEMLTQCFQALNLYGKEPEQLAAAIPLFQMVLSDYPIAKIRIAFTRWLKNNSAFPAPADIAGLIERDGRPLPDKAVYVSISRKPGDQRTKADWEYLRNYEDFISKGGAP